MVPRVGPLARLPDLQKEYQRTMEEANAAILSFSLF